MQELFSNIYRNKRVLITGHSGFKGSWLTLWLNNLGAQVFGFSLPESTIPSHFKLLQADCRSTYGDIKNANELQAFFKKVQPDIVFHLAAQSLVRDSYRNPLSTYETNIIGSLNVFEAARKCKHVKVIINVTTDKVYENNEEGIPYKESDRLGGYDMYSSSKACSEILTSSYRNSFLHDHSILLASARAGNVIGGGDWANERLIPDLIKSVTLNKPVDIRSPRSIRPWEHVLEPLSGYLLLGQKLLENREEFATSWNFGPSPEHFLSVGDVIHTMKEKWSKINFTIDEEQGRQFHEAGVLKLDCTKAFKQLHWKSVWSMDETILKTVNWYKNYVENNSISSQKDLEAYIIDAKRLELSWTN